MTQRTTLAAVLISTLFLAPHVGVCAVAVYDSSDAELAMPTGCRDFLDFADALREEGDHYRAITEYKRVAHSCPDDSLRALARGSIGEVLFEAGRYGLVVDWYERLEANDARLPRAELLAGRSLFRLERYAETVALLSPLHRRQTRSAHGGVPSLGGLSDGGVSYGEASHDEAAYYVGLAQIRTGKFRQAEGSLSLVGDTPPYSDRACRYLDALRSEPRPSRKSPGVAAALAVVPGVGYAYAEHYGTAVASFIVNGLLGWATVDAFRDGNDGAGGFYALLATGFYLGNITGSAQSVDRYNAYQDERFQAMFRE